MSDSTASQWPRISIVTPSLNQGRYLEQTIQSVLACEYPNLEYLVIDGGSTDNSAAIIEKYRGRLAYAVSEKDDGQYDAINRGLQRCTGDVMAWLNADDCYVPGALHVVGDIFRRVQGVRWLTSGFPLMMDDMGRYISASHIKCSQASFAYGCHAGFTPTHRRYIQQESTFWSRALWTEAGGMVDKNFQMAGDFDLWARLMKQANIHVVKAPLGVFRIHAEQKTAAMSDLYGSESKESFARHGYQVPSALKRRAMRWAKAIPVLKRQFAWEYNSLSYVGRESRWNQSVQRFL